MHKTCVTAKIPFAFRNDRKKAASCFYTNAVVDEIAFQVGLNPSIRPRDLARQLNMPEINIKNHMAKLTATGKSAGVVLINAEKQDIETFDEALGNYKAGISKKDLLSKVAPCFRDDLNNAFKATQQGLKVTVSQDSSPSKEKSSFFYVYNATHTPTSGYLNIDEIAIHRGHSYITVVRDLGTKEPLYEAKSKRKAVVTKFVELMGKEAEKIKAVACDMNASFQNSFMELCPHVDIVHDHFHVKQHFGDSFKKVIAKAHYKANKLKDTLRMEYSNGRMRVLLLANEETWKKCAEKRGMSKGIDAEEIIESYRNDSNKAAELCPEIVIGLRIKKLLQTAFTASDSKEMRTTLNQLIQACEAANYEPFTKFAQMIKGHLDNVVTYGDCHISTNSIEGFNSKIRALRYSSCGGSDDVFLMLRVMACGGDTYQRTLKLHNVYEKRQCAA